MKSIHAVYLFTSFSSCFGVTCLLFDLLGAAGTMNWTGYVFYKQTNILTKRKKLTTRLDLTKYGWYGFTVGVRRGGCRQTVLHKGRQEMRQECRGQ